MLRSLICNKTLKKVCCPEFDDSESKDSDSDVEEIASTTTTVASVESENKDAIFIAENDKNVEYLKNLTSR